MGPGAATRLIPLRRTNANGGTVFFVRGRGGRTLKWSFQVVSLFCSRPVPCTRCSLRLVVMHSFSRAYYTCTIRITDYGYHILFVLNYVLSHIPE